MRIDRRMIEAVLAFISVSFIVVSSYQINYNQTIVGAFRVMIWANILLMISWTLLWYEKEDTMNG